jgi:methylmalonyl-CoA mutase cobalamin-binding subunit
VHSGAHLTLFRKVLALMKEKGLDDVLLTGGGVSSRKGSRDLGRPRASAGSSAPARRFVNSPSTCATETARRRPR